MKAKTVTATATCPKCGESKALTLSARAAKVAYYWYRCEACNLEFNLTEFERANQAAPTLEQLS